MAPLFLALAQLAPALLRLAGKDNAAEVVDQGVSIAKRLAGKDDPDAALEAIRANPQLLVEFQRTMNDIVIAELEAETRRLEAINQTMRAEITSADPYVRRARPTFLYVMAGTWALQTLAFFIAVISYPTEAPKILASLGDVAFMWTIALSVIGVYVKVRSDDKKVAAGQEPPTAVEALGRIFKRSG